LTVERYHRLLLVSRGTTRLREPATDRSTTSRCRRAKRCRIYISRSATLTRTTCHRGSLTEMSIRRRPPACPKPRTPQQDGRSAPPARDNAPGTVHKAAL